jgi:glycosyltransferase involved in cell wall biosynthesis
MSTIAAVLRTRLRWYSWLRAIVHYGFRVKGRYAAHRGDASVLRFLFTHPLRLAIRLGCFFQVVRLAFRIKSWLFWPSVAVENSVAWAIGSWRAPRSVPIVSPLPATRREIVMLVVSDLRIDPRVEREARALAAAGWRVLIIAPDISSPSLATAPIDWGPRVSFRLLPFETAQYVMQEPWLASEEMYRAAMMFRPFAYHCHDLNTALIGLRAAHAAGARWLCDFHEWYSENVTWNAANRAWEPHEPAKAALFRWAERVCLRRADAVITVNRSIADELEQMVGAEPGRVTVIRNIPPLNASPTRAYPPLKAQFAIPTERFIVLYQGGTGPTRLLEPVIEALALAAKVTLVIRGPSLNLFGADYRRIAEAAGVGERLVLADPVPSCDVVAAARGADAGLWTLPNLSRNFFYALPNKVFEYMASGLPLLVANFPEPKRIVDEFGVGLAFDPYDSASIAAQMNRLVEDAGFLARCREAVPRALAALDAGAEWQRLTVLYDRLRRAGMMRPESASSSPPPDHSRSGVPRAAHSVRPKRANRIAGPTDDS